MTEDEMKALEALVAGATEGPWRANDETGEIVLADGSGRYCALAVEVYGENAGLMAAARTAVPALITEVRRLRGALETAQRDTREGVAAEVEDVACDCGHVIGRNIAAFIRVHP